MSQSIREKPIYRPVVEATNENSDTKPVMFCAGQYIISLVHIICFGVPTREWLHFAIWCVVYGTVPCSWYVYVSVVNRYKQM
jgi:hypothetical protein